MSIEGKALLWGTVALVIFLLWWYVMTLRMRQEVKDLSSRFPGRKELE